MTSKIKNVLIFLVIGAILILVYIFFIKSPAEEPSLVSSTPTGAVTGVVTSMPTNTTDAVSAGDFLVLLLNVTSIKLNDAIFSDQVFLSLHDSSIILVPDINPGRPNPFAPIGSDVVTEQPASTPPATTTTVITPPATSSTPATSGTPATP